MNKELYISLISRQLSSELNTSQLQNLNSWLSKSKDNANLLDEFKQTWDATSSYKQSLAIDVDSSFASFADKFNIPTTQTPIAKEKPSNFKRNLLLALLLLLLLSMGAIYNSITSNTIFNNKQKALLTYADSNTEITLSPNSTYNIGASNKISLTTADEFNSILNSSTLDSDSDSFIGHNLNFIESSSKYFSAEDFVGQGYVDLNNDKFKFIGLENGRSVAAKNASFNIQNYKDDNMTVLDVQSGKVLFNSNGKSFVVNEGERAIFDKTSGKLLKAENPSVNPFKWHKGILVFNATPLDEAFLMLGRFYGVDIEVDQASDLDNKNFTATFPISSDLNDCLELINTSFKMDIERINTRTIKISNIHED